MDKCILKEINMFNLLEIVKFAPMVLIALTFHEFAHGWVSKKLGDPTPEMTGRLTLNPLAHLDPVGALLMLFTGFGWAKPVQINPGYYKDPKKGMALTALAGPVSNFLLSVIAMIIYGVCFIIYAKTGALENAIDDIASLTMQFVVLNLSFMIFNFIPIPPLDGSRVLGVFLSDSAYFRLQQYERYSFMLIILLSVTNVFDRIIGTGVNFVFIKLLEGLEFLVMMVI